MLRSILLFFFFNDTATTEIYTLSLHDALPISGGARPHRTRRLRPDSRPRPARAAPVAYRRRGADAPRGRALPLLEDRKSTRLNSSHGYISYAVFCLKKKKTKPHHTNSPHSTRT